MSQNPPPNLPPVMPAPPLAPQPLGYAQADARADLRTVAIRQRAIMYCILAYIVAAILRFVLPFPANLIMALVVLAAMITGAVFVFMLAISLYNVGVGVTLGILTLIPLVGLIVLLIVNGKATNVLRDHGVHGGLMGAKLSQIPPPGQMPIR